MQGLVLEGLRRGSADADLRGTLSSEGLSDTDGRNRRVPLGNT